MPIRGAVGVLGRPGWAEVDERGAVRAADGSWRLDWWVGADRWRDPRAEVAVRHGARDGTPVFETALRVDGGDVRQRVYAAAERDGLVMVEVENDSPAPVAIAFLLRGARARTLISPRPPTVVAGPSGPGAPPAEASRFPLPHRGVLRVAVPFAGSVDHVAGSCSERRASDLRLARVARGGQSGSTRPVRGPIDTPSPDRSSCWSTTSNPRRCSSLSACGCASVRHHSIARLRTR